MPIINKTKRTAAIYNRGREVVKVYDHGTLAWQKSITDYLCFTALESGTFTLTIPAAVTATYLSYIEWSKDGRTWNHTDNTSEAVTIDVQVAQGDKVYWRGSGICMTKQNANQGYTSLFSSTGTFNVSGHIMSLLKGDNFAQFQHLDRNISGTGILNVTFARLFEGCSTIVNAKDLILPTFTSWYTYIFQYMFYNSSLVSAPNLPSLDTASNCYSFMFNLCTSLTQAPSSIAATTLRTQCCRSMFEGDTALVTAPSIAATTLDGGGELYRTFSGCTSLVTPPSDLLPISINVASYYMTFNNCRSMTTKPTLHFTSIASDGVNACLNMFAGCSSLTGEVTIDVPSAPKSAFSGMFGSTRITKAYVRCPIAGEESFRQTFFNVQTLSDIDIIGATSVGVNAYLSCFYGCRATRQSIVLPATILAEGCYKQMFYSSGYTINKVTCLATDISATDCLTNWLANAASTGTFIQAEGVTWPRGASGIPTGWLAYDEGEDIPNDYAACDYIHITRGSGMVADVLADKSTYGCELEYNFTQNELDAAANNNTCIPLMYYQKAVTTDPDFPKQINGQLYLRYNADWLGWQRNAGIYTRPATGEKTTNSSALIIKRPAVTGWHYIRCAATTTDDNFICMFDDEISQTGKNYYLLMNENPTDEPAEIYISCRNKNSSYPIDNGGDMKYFKIIHPDGETIVADYVPCVRKSDNVAGFWDKVGLVFKSSFGTPFVAGYNQT